MERFFIQVKNGQCNITKQQDEGNSLVLDEYHDEE